MKLGCHCVLFRERIATETEFVLTNMAATGFQGVEMGARFFGTERKDELKAALEKAGIELAALHVGVPMDVWQNEPEKAIETVLQAARFIVDFPNKNLTLSASPCDNLEQVVAAMNKAAIACREMGVRLNYHNHAAEFNVNDAAMYKGSGRPATASARMRTQEYTAVICIAERSVTALPEVVPPR